MGTQSDTGSNVIHTPQSPDGYQVGRNAADLVGFFGATPIAQPTAASQAAVAVTGSTSTTPFGYTTAAQADAIVALVNQMRLVLVNLGVMKGS